MISVAEWTPATNRAIAQRMWDEQDAKWLDLCAKAEATTPRAREQMLSHLFSGTHTSTDYVKTITGGGVKARWVKFHKTCPICRMYLAHDGEVVPLKAGV